MNFSKGEAIEDYEPQKCQKSTKSCPNRSGNFALYWTNVAFFGTDCFGIKRINIIKNFFNKRFQS